MNYLLSGTGSYNLVITAPHGGSKRPKDIPFRKYGRTVRDTYSYSIATYMIRYGMYYIISEIHRSRVDFNRDVEMGAQGNPQAKELWYTWHNLLDTYCTTSGANSKTLYIDIHSHNDSDEFHLGYDIQNESYNKLMNRSITSAGSSIVAVEENHSLYDLVFGEHSLKNTLEAKGYKIHSPKDNAIYFNGGYNIESHMSGNTAAIQIEVPVSVARQSTVKLARDLYSSIMEFKNNYVDRSTPT